MGEIFLSHPGSLIPISLMYLDVLLLWAASLVAAVTAPHVVQGRGQARVAGGLQDVGYTLVHIYVKN